MIMKSLYLLVSKGKAVCQVLWQWIGDGGWVALIGAIVIAVGGFATTKGWDIVNQNSAKRSLLIAVAQECQLNQLFMRSPPLQFSTEKVPDIIKRHYCYPQIRFSAAEEAIRSSLFDLNKPDEKKFKVVLTDFVTGANEVNNSFRIMDMDLSLASVTQEKRFEKYSEIRQGPLVIKFRKDLTLLIDHMETHYMQAMAEAIKLMTPDYTQFGPPKKSSVKEKTSRGDKTED